METGSNDDDQKSVMMPRGFKAAFDAVCKYYGCSEEEIKQMRANVRADPEAAAETFFRMQKEIELAKLTNAN